MLRFFKSIVMLSVGFMLLLSALVSIWVGPFVWSAVRLSDLAQQTLDEEKVFISVGELSGDRLGAWYLTKRLNMEDRSQCFTIGQHNLLQAGAHYVEGFASLAQNLHIAQGVKLLSNIPRARRDFERLTHYLVDNRFKKIVLVDFPIVNIPLAIILKKQNPQVHITYIAPPELWFWGTWGIDTFLKKYCDEVIVLYPHEQAWYAEHGLQVSWYGYPFIDEFLLYIEQVGQKQPCIALLPGSRPFEVDTYGPLFLEVAQKLKQQYPEISFVIPMAASCDYYSVKAQVIRYGLQTCTEIVTSDMCKKQVLSVCCCALTKPGTITLELALLGVPTVMVLKQSWINDLLFTYFVHQRWVSLPNLLAQQDICSELKQNECNVDALFQHIHCLYASYKENTALYQIMCNKLKSFKAVFIGR